ncbi:MAG: TRAP transporter fused permease subunit [Firmicutes bacterium]|jgi:TRAP transporter 4TM/12TM fusion protein|nr:TRAP transporter fused permease subunit [Bacillota bacterium]
MQQAENEGSSNMTTVMEDWTQKLLKAVVLMMAAYHFYVALTGMPEPMVVRPIHIAFVLFLGFLKYRGGKKQTRIPWYDWLFAIAGVSSAVYILFEYQRIVWRLPFFDPLTVGDWIFGILTIALVLELTRRTVGKTLVGIVVFLIIYTLYGKYFPGLLRHPGIPAKNLLEHLFLTTNGLYGSLASLSLAEIFMFIFFGALIQEAGGSEFFTRVAIALTGKARGGPAKAAVLGSALFGCISGSGTANVFATGSVTIPLMKKTGFNPEFAGAVEAVASSLGQLIPPVMGAAAFLIAEFSRRPYMEVAAAAAVPAILYVFAVYLAVHFQAEKAGIGIYQTDEEEPGIWETFRDYGHILLPVIVLVVLLAQRRTAYYSSTMATLSVILVSYLRPTTRMNWAKLSEAVETAIWRVITIASTLLSAGVAVAALQTTGTPYRLTAVIVQLAQGNMFGVLLLVAMTVIVLGMGLPVTGAFLIASVFGASALMEFGIDPFVTYMFIFMYGILAPITPPVCLSSFAAASIAETSFIRTGIRGFILGIPAYIIPFMVAYNPTLLNIFGSGFWFGIQSFITAIIGIIALVSATEGWMNGQLNLFQRAVLFIIAFGLLWPGTASDIIGLAGVALVFYSQRIRQRSAAI